MKVRQALGMGLLLVVASLPIHAQTSTTVAPYEDFAKHLRAAQEITPLTSTMFGDKLSLYNGETEFDVTDIDLPGNSSLPVRLTRRFQIQDRRIDPDNLYGFDDWDLDVPYIDGVFTTENGWQVIGTDYPQTASNSRCSIPNPPWTVMADNGNLEEPAAVIWDGNMLHIPGEVDDEELLSNTEAKLPTVTDGNTYPWVTKSLYRARCASSTANGYPGESYVVVTPSGVRYTFNWVTTRQAPQVTFQTPNLSGSGSLNAVANRTRYFMLATRVDDRFGNWVTYTYNASSQLTQITANDGRVITINWSGSAVSWATATSPSGGAPRTWQYGYGSNGLPTGTLTSVTRPDGSQWTYTINSGSILSGYQGQDNEPQPSHCQLEPIINTGSFNYTIGAPSGAVGTFNFVFQRNYRNYVPESCTGSNPYTLYPDTKDFFDNFQLTSKSITGAGLPSENWTYSYDTNAGGYFLATVLPLDAFAQETYIPQTVAASKVVTVTDPSEVTKYTFGTSYGLNEGRLLSTEVDSLSGTMKKTVTTTYLDDGSVASEPFPDNVGVSIQPVYKNPMVGRQRPEVMTTTVQDSTTYNRQTTAFNAFAQPTQVTRGSTTAGQTSIQEQTTYYNDQTDWVLGQVQELDNLTTGETEKLNTYNPNATLYSSARFGETLLTYGYNAQGQLASFIDGNGNTTGLNNYYRGIPQLINYPDQTTQSAVVDDFGDITSVTDQNGHTTSYSYNSVGWPVQITYPTGDEVAWYPKVYTFNFVTGAERGIAANHWRRTITTGSYNEVTYFDAMLHPLLTDTTITGVSGSDINTASTFDWKGQTLFASYPTNGTADWSGIALGTHKTYDELGRVTQSQQDAEASVGSLLTTTTSYLPGPGTQMTDPKGNVTTTYYQVFDEPSYDAPIQVQSPGGITQTIGRDLYGNPLTITQSGLYGTESDSVTKTLTYDTYHRLCRTNEPESGDNFTAYDLANNIRFTANGLTLSETGCARDGVPVAAQTTYTYDAMNRVKTIAPPAGTQSTSYTYDFVGNLKTAVSGISTWQGVYNYRNMLTGESLQLTGLTPWALGYAHDANGNLSLIQYPNGETVSYNPNPRGRARQVGSYASNIGYFPNDAVASFTYGNGTSYVADQNARQMLSDFSYGTGSALNLSEVFSYDGDANIQTVQDMVNGQRSKIFQYDGLNRLTSASAPGLSINETYGYDALNNLRQRVINGLPFNLNIDATNRLNNMTVGSSLYASYGYDSSGDRSSVTSGGTTVNYTFDAKQQLLVVPTVASYAYDASGRRVMKTPVNGGAPTYSFYDHGGQLMYQYAPGSSQGTNYIYLSTKLIARNNTIVLSPPGAITFSSNPSGGNYTVSWGAVPLAASYTLQESSNGGAWTTISVGSATSVALSGRAGGSYVYQVQACASDGCSGWTTSATLGVTPSPPTNLTVPSGLVMGSYTVSWTAPVSATNYTVQTSLNGGAWSTIDSNISATSITLDGTVAGTRTFQVSASNAYGPGGWTVSAPITVFGVPGPITFDHNPNGGNFTVSWGAVPLATSYNVQESFNSGAWVTVASSSGTSVTLSGRAGGSYIYQVQGCANGACGPWTTSGTLGVWPSAPTNVAGPTSLTFAPFTVSWTAPVGATSYTVQQSFNGGAWTTLTTGITTASISVTSAPGGSYAYQVSASNSYGTSAWGVASPAISVTQVPDTPTNVVIDTTSGLLTWDAMPWATTYIVVESAGGIHLGTYTYTVSTNSWDLLPDGKTSTIQLQACSMAGCSAQVDPGARFGEEVTLKSTIGALIQKGKRVLGDDAGSGTGCNATTCSVILGGSP